MAYQKITNRQKERNIRYVSKDFIQFKENLVQFTQTYFPKNFNDFSEGNPGMMFMEMAAYVGDILSFYTDTQMQETFLSLANDTDNIYNMAYAMGYKPKTTTASSVDLDLSIVIPSKLVNGSYEPDYDYAITVNENSTFGSGLDAEFKLTKDVRFSFSSSFDPTSVSIYQYDASDNPEYYLLKKTCKAISAKRRTQDFPIGRRQKFRTISLFDTDVISVESIVDREGNEYFEVPYLAQDTIFEEIINNASNDPSLHQYNHQTPYLLKMKKVPKRFVTRCLPNNILEIQFGAGGIGDKADEEIIPNPDNVGLGIKDGKSKLDKAFDPSNFLFTKAYGETPENTTLTVTYLTGGGLVSNVESNTITNKIRLDTQNKVGLNASMLQFVENSLLTTNPQPAKGGGSGDTVDEVRMNTMANFAAQQRTVTKEDYLIRTLSMPAHLGRVSKAYITQDDQISPLTNEPNRIPNPLALNLYTLGYNATKQLTTLNTATKTNLSTYLEQYRMLTDAVNIKDAFIINFNIEFEITVFKNFNNQETLLECISNLKDYFNIDGWQINQPIIISEVKNLIGEVKGVQTVENVIFKNIFGESSGYSQYKYGFERATREGVIYPSLDPSIFELKYPNEDIKGRVITY
tara:strand:- start:29 stop:1924 length:1896 start_codon:yes stop_codon:yes gene_type:complete